MSTVVTKNISVQNSAGTAAANISFDGTANAAKTIGVKPMFSAYQTVAQSVSHNAPTKVNLQATSYNLTNCFDTSTSRFTPSVAGYYQVGGGCELSNRSEGTSSEIRKNGMLYRKLGFQGQGFGSYGSCMVYMNGTTDYIELYTYQSSGNTLTTSPTSWTTYLEAHYIANAQGVM